MPPKKKVTKATKEETKSKSRSKSKSKVEVKQEDVKMIKNEPIV